MPPITAASQSETPATPIQRRATVAIAYFSVLALTVAAIGGVIQTGFRRTWLFELNAVWVYLLLFLATVLAALIIYPIAVLYQRAVHPSKRALHGDRKSLSLAVILIVLTPITFIIVFITVCGTAIAVMGRRP
jgi:hypothetical protein